MDQNTPSATLPPIMIGRQLTAPSDPLERISLTRVFQGLTRPKPAFRDLVSRLRTVASVDLSQYRQLKKGLPYLVCGLFHPAIRRKAHFAAIHYFVLDLDHLAEAGLTITEVRRRLEGLREPMLGFVSPGGDGYKILFRLQTPCSDAARFHVFYQHFARAFAREHGLESVVDYQTCDVTRACFMSFDPKAFFRPEAEAVEMEHYLQRQPEPEPAATTKVTAPPPERKTPRPAAGPDEQTLEHIREKLNPGRRKPRPKQQIVQPEEISAAVSYFSDHLAEYDLKLAANEAISYGRRLRIEAKNGSWCELNLFYGKRGFSIVKTTRTGSHPELADLVAQVLRELLYDRFEQRH